ncbi:hypothetical protein [Kroppenstedtia sanguinis]|uniref:HMA domain-containing protein n=1 Tax=Kroppenstedtia sanguinis TaxID=1380684 RepID=A0ABW4C7W5_9BACL
MIRKILRIQPGAEAKDIDQLQHALSQVWGIRTVDIHEPVGEVILAFDEKATSLQDFHQAIRESGWEVDDEQQTE